MRHLIYWQALGCLCVALTAAEVRVMRVPDGGVQPDAAVDAGGRVHLIYFKGKDRGGDIYYTRLNADGRSFETPIRVNQQAGSAIAVGSIRGAHLALGKNGRAHVAWMGGEGARRAMIRGREATPMMYARLADDGKAFEPEKNVLTHAAGLDGGGSVAADPHGNVFVSWHATDPDSKEENEAGRAVFIAESKDEGRTFQPERRALTESTGACGCCGMRIFADSRQGVYLLYRGAATISDRPEILASASGKNPFAIRLQHPWQITSCPMSSASFFQSASGVLAAWETEGQVYWTLLKSPDQPVEQNFSPEGKVKRKHPAIAARENEIFLAWTEGTGWNKGGTVGWQRFDSKGNPMGQSGRAEGLPVWGLVAVAPLRAGGFIVIY